MNEIDTLEMTMEIAKEIVKEVYNDTAKTFMKSTGEFLALFPRAIMAGLAPVQKWILDMEYDVQKHKKLLEEKLKVSSSESEELSESGVEAHIMQNTGYGEGSDDTDLENKFSEDIDRYISFVNEIDRNPNISKEQKARIKNEAFEKIVGIKQTFNQYEITDDIV